jgi:transcriptional regulator of acetoin/glycerol metabolism
VLGRVKRQLRLVFEPAMEGTRLREGHGSVDQAARRLGIPRSSLYARIKKLGIALSKV